MWKRTIKYYTHTHTHARTLVSKLGLLRKLQELKSNVDDNTECDRKHKHKHDVSVLTW